MKVRYALIQACLLGVMVNPLAAEAQPVITGQPANQTVILGGNVILSVTATDVGPLSYQWQFNGTNLPNNIITTVAGNGNFNYSGDGGLATNATMRQPVGLCFDALGNMYVGDYYNSRVRVVNTNGFIRTFAGSGSPFYSGDGGAATNAGLDLCAGMAFDVIGNLYIAIDAGSYPPDFRVRKVDTNGIITTVAGTNIRRYFGDGGAATNAGLTGPTDVALDNVGNLYIADRDDNCISKVDTNGIITTVAGRGSVQVDGGAATNALISAPTGVTLDASGNLYITERDRSRIRKVDTNGIITTVAGNGIQGYSGDGAAATNANINLPEGVVFDASGNLYVTDSQNNRIRKVDTIGIITTIAGNGVQGYSGDGGAATNASLNTPAFGAFDIAGNFYFTDAGNNCMREVHVTGLPYLSINNAGVNSVGNYSVIVTSASGSVTSSVVTVNLQLPPITPSFNASNGTFNFTWSSVSNLTYQLQSATNLAAPVWIDLGSPVTATNNSMSTTDDLAAAEQKFYRVRLVQ